MRFLRRSRVSSAAAQISSAAAQCDRPGFVFLRAFVVSAENRTRTSVLSTRISVSSAAAQSLSSELFVLSTSSIVWPEYRLVLCTKSDDGESKVGLGESKAGLGVSEVGLGESEVGLGESKVGHGVSKVGLWCVEGSTRCHQ